MKRLHRRFAGILVCGMALIVFSPVCDLQGTAPVLNDLVIKAVGARSITLGQPSLAEKGNPSPTIDAYIGPTGTILLNGTTVSGATEGPVSVSAGDYQFKGLTTGSKYDIIVIAINSSGTSVKRADALVPSIPVINPASYPGIGTDEMGLLRWYLALADDPLSDFSKIESFDPEQTEGSSYRYSIAFITYFLALEQYHALPSCTEIIRPRFDRMIQKMIRPEVWTYWAVTSQGVELLEPLMNKPYPSKRDPVLDQNIMYSGHLGMMIASYEMLYRDMKWSEPGSIVFEWSDTEKYVYDNHSLQKVMYDQMADNSYHSIECEPNAVFPECNQHPVISFMLYDHVHGTKLGEIRELFMDFFLKKNMINPVTHEVCVNYLVKQNLVVSHEFANFGNLIALYTIPAAWTGSLCLHSAAADGWTGAFMHAWQPEYIERHYPYQKKRHVVEPDALTARLDPKIEQATNQLATPFFAMLSAETGDTVTRDRLVAWCRDFYKPVWDNGMLHYTVGEPVNVNTTGEFTTWGNATTGALISCAMAGRKNGMWDFVNKPFTERNYTAPRVTGVDYPNALLARAVYDFDRESLIVTVVPGASTSGTTSFTIDQLDPSRTWELFIDGVAQRYYTGVSSIRVEVSLVGKHDVVLIAE